MLQKGDHYEETIYACAGAFTTIKWGKVNIQGVAPVDSVLIAGNDTSYYTIKY
ncbi:MAG: hypothetical protein IPJ82_15770 [Lewinellaceae bacterium]|nr:hypothetical protein [Lewinellaceae bacterium]